MQLHSRRNGLRLPVMMALLFFPFALMAQDIDLPIEPHADMSTNEAFAKRMTHRKFLENAMPIEELGGLLWAADGYNRPEDKKRTAPSARNVQEIDLYVFTKEAVYRYEPEGNRLIFLKEGDFRSKISSQKHFGVAPIAIVLVANYDRMSDFDEESRGFYAAVDCGYISQNIYLYCAAHPTFGTVACGAIDRDFITKFLGLKNAKPLLAHPVGEVSK